MVLRTRLRCAPRILGPPRLVRRDSRVSCRVTERRLGTRPLAVANAPFKTRLSLREITRATRGIYMVAWDNPIKQQYIYLLTSPLPPLALPSGERSTRTHTTTYILRSEERTMQQRAQWAHTPTSHGTDRSSSRAPCVARKGRGRGTRALKNRAPARRTTDHSAHLTVSTCTEASLRRLTISRTRLPPHPGPR